MKESHHPRAWIETNIFDFVAKHYYRSSFNVNNSTYTRQPNLLDIKCICIPICYGNHFSVACVFNLKSKIPLGRDDELPCILHYDSITRTHNTDDIGYKIQDILNILCNDKN